MNILIDSHILLWSLQEPYKINEHTRSLMQNASERYFSIASVWELTIKHNKGSLAFATQDILEAIEKFDFTILQVTPDHVLGLKDKVLTHKDPFDNMLVAQAKAEGLKLITADWAIIALGLDFVIDASAKLGRDS